MTSHRQQLIHFAISSSDPYIKMGIISNTYLSTQFCIQPFAKSDAVLHDLSLGNYKLYCPTAHMDLYKFRIYIELTIQKNLYHYKDNSMKCLIISFLRHTKSHYTQSFNCGFGKERTDWISTNLVASSSQINCF